MDLPVVLIKKYNDEKTSIVCPVNALNSWSHGKTVPGNLASEVSKVNQITDLNQNKSGSKTRRNTPSLTHN